MNQECLLAAALSAVPRLGTRRLGAMLGVQTPSRAIEMLGCEAPSRTDIELMAAKLAKGSMSVTYIGANDYPQMLLNDVARPAVLFYRGDLQVLQQRRVGIVGTRSATAAGRYMASHLAYDLSEQGVAIVSGLARGVDAWAHKGVLLALDREGVSASESHCGQPIAVVASGLDMTYPKENADLWRFVAENGLLLTESPPGTMPEAFRFPLRNRILAALCELVVVIESHAKGGSMITVEEAQRRDITVMAVPGSPRSLSSAGTNLLLQQGCAPVVDATDVMVALGLDNRRNHPQVFDSRRTPSLQDQALIAHMRGEAVTLDQLLMRASTDLVQTALALGRLESEGWVVNNAGWWEVLGMGCQ
ncbi:MAG: DNA-processing protein DprA [Actinobacteria bacterium]|nr:MAG: DNA-processing protein DprA [Actinomycetota bacterium]